MSRRTITGNMERRYTKIRQNGKYRFIVGNDDIFGIRPIENVGEVPEFQTTSDYLYIKTDFFDNNQLDEHSPLMKLIHQNFIVKMSDTPITIMSNKTKKLKRSFYYAFTFYRELIDERKYDENNKPDYDDDISINENDCLKFGEIMTFINENPNSNTNPQIFTKFIQDGYETSVLQSGNHVFGLSDRKNIDLLNKIPIHRKNNNALPNIGQNYGIIRNEIVDDMAPYHISHVIYSYNDVNITIEAEADNGNIYKPKFCFYDRNPEGYTFHKRWSGILDKDTDEERYNALYTNGETIVLESRDIQTIIHEMTNEDIGKISVKPTVKKSVKKSVKPSVK